MNPPPEIGIAAPELVEQRAEAELRRHRRLDRDRQFRRHIDPRRLIAARLVGGERDAIEKSARLCEFMVASPLREITAKCDQIGAMLVHTRQQILQGRHAMPPEVKVRNLSDGAQAEGFSGDGGRKSEFIEFILQLRAWLLAKPSSPHCPSWARTI